MGLRSSSEVKLWREKLLCLPALRINNNALPVMGLHNVACFKVTLCWKDRPCNFYNMGFVEFCNKVVNLIAFTICHFFSFLLYFALEFWVWLSLVSFCAVDWQFGVLGPKSCCLCYCIITKKNLCLRGESNRLETSLVAYDACEIITEILICSQEDLFLLLETMTIC